MPRHANTLPLLATLALLIAACAPTTEKPRLEIGSVPDLTTAHPNQTGLEWRYLYPNDALDAQPIIHRVLGPMSEKGQVLTVEHTWGRGYDHHYYRSYTPEGVYLHRETRPGVTITYDPPLHELPSGLEVRPGAAWGGTTTTIIAFDQGVTETHTLTYQSIIHEQRTVTLPDGEHQVLVIDFQSVDDAGHRVAQQLWYQPFLGWVKLRDDAVLVASNAGRGGL